MVNFVSSRLFQRNSRKECNISNAKQGKMLLLLFFEKICRFSFQSPENYFFSYHKTWLKERKPLFLMTMDKIATMNCLFSEGKIGAVFNLEKFYNKIKFNRQK